MVGDDEQAAYAAWADELESDEYEPHPDMSGQVLAYEGQAAVEASRAFLSELIGTERVEAARARIGRVENRWC